MSASSKHASLLTTQGFTNFKVQTILRVANHTEIGQTSRGNEISSNGTYAQLYRWRFVLRFVNLEDFPHFVQLQWITALPLHKFPTIYISVCVAAQTMSPHTINQTNRNSC